MVNPTKEKIQYMKSVARCELCGSQKTLELHHIIPITYGGPDVLDNWIAICSGCHAKLTPKALLTKHGLFKNCYKHNQKPVIDFLERVQKELPTSGAEILDIFLEVFQSYGEREVICYYADEEV